MFFSRNKHKYNIFLWGENIVEDALQQKINKSSKLNKLYTSKDFFKSNEFDNMYYTEYKMSESDINKLVDYAKKANTDIFICDWSDNTQGVMERMEAEGIKTIGVNKKWSKLEAYKDFGKKFMINNNIKTADYILVDNYDDFKKNLSKFNFPVVIKANQFACGLGAYICKNIEQAEEAYSILTSGKSYSVQTHIIIEEYIEGIEFDLISLWDGKTLFTFPALKDYKRRFENDEGYNTGSMGQYFPYKIPDKYKMQVKYYIEKLEKAFKRYKVDYRGAIYSALIANDNGIYCIEYNTRIGLTEGPLFTVHSDDDIVNVIEAIVNQKLSKLKIKWKKGFAACISIVSKNYPYIVDEKMSVTLSAYNKLKESDINIFHNFKTYIKEDRLYKNGSIFMCLIKSSKDPIKDIYNELGNLKFDENFSNCDYRTDIGK